MMRVNSGRLPSEYQETEFLRSNASGAYILTNILEDSELIIEMKYQCNDIGWPFGARIGAGNKQYGINTANGANGINARYGSQPDIKFFNFDTTQPILFTMNGKTKKASAIKNNGETANVNLGNETFQTEFPFAIFTVNNNGTPIIGNNYDGSVYYFRVYDDSILVSDFVPCYRKSDNKPGMYDLCGSICPLTNSPFYINAGTGEFLVGPDVN